MKRKDFDWLTDEFMLYCRSTQLRKKTMLSYEQTLRLFEKEAHPFRENGCDVLPVFAFWRVCFPGGRNSRTPGDGCPYASIPCFVIIHFRGLLSMYSQVSS